MESCTASLSLSLSRCSRRQPIPRAYDRKVCAIITVVIARAYTTALNAASGGSGVENTEYNRWTNCRGNRRVNALFPRYRYISLLVFIIPRLLQHGEYANSLEFVKIFFNDDTSNLEITRFAFSILLSTQTYFLLIFPLLLFLSTNLRRD